MKHVSLILCALYACFWPHLPASAKTTRSSAAPRSSAWTATALSSRNRGGLEKKPPCGDDPGKSHGCSRPGRKVSSPSVPDTMKSVVVGCAECHTQRPESHADTFSHNGFDVHVVVSPEDCAACHSQERDQYGGNIMAHAWKNLAENKLYQDLKQTIIGTPVANPASSPLIPRMP